MATQEMLALLLSVASLHKLALAPPFLACACAHMRAPLALPTDPVARGQWPSPFEPKQSTLRHLRHRITTPQLSPEF
eukprot:6190842-Pleurochrysis_carterae.AAC.2